MSQPTKNKKIILCILDGFGIGEDGQFNAVKNANTQNLDTLFKKFPSSQLICSGPDVGLPEGTMGNSEVGHLNIGAGRVIYQDISRIDRSIKDGSFIKNPVLNEIISDTKEKNSSLHLLGLVSDGNVHASLDHLKALIQKCTNEELENVYIHIFTDGRDTPPESGINYIKNLSEFLKEHTAKIASVSGRYYAMDRDNRWDRVKLAYNMLTTPHNGKDITAEEIILNSYSNDITDEFILPQRVIKNGKSIANIKHGDSVIFFNYRSDRARELSLALNNMNGVEFDTVDIELNYITMTQYQEDFPFKVISPKEHYKNILGQIVSDKGLNQLRIAETEKYAHVTFFFNGGEDTSFPGEERILVSSPKVATYDLQPEMSAFQVTEKLIEELKKDKYSLIVLNFANCDMVGHTGIYNAALKAVETIDVCIEEIYKVAKDVNYTMIITADHGNAEKMKDGEIPFTAHTKNKVPFLITDEGYSLVDGKLADIAPTILKLLEIEIPSEMSGNILIK
ncbi:MAG: 2,3-bisphosphoglycerate-independent phosphoglycerate mutase [Candidatus Delongbacteria bacterium]|jgi:2,3-bisphosphoglycerate-independent phosphoglycerate mutase|nr:2,3-bisphosphoglycerate-independent phosphoglycerate mutase [Candidatus Delongbacteria bacterium]